MAMSVRNSADLMMRAGWPTRSHTHPDSGGTVVLVVLAAIVIASAAGPVIDAVAELLRLVLIAAAVILGLALAAGAAVVALRLRHRPPPPLSHGHVHRIVAPDPAQPLSAPRHPAIEAPREVHIHIHGASAEDIAEALRQLPD